MSVNCEGATSALMETSEHLGSVVEVSVVMPCLNEAETIATCIKKATRSLAENDISGEIVIGDNGSTDDSAVLAHGLGARVVEVHERGYGATLTGAIEASKGQLIVFADADDSYDFGEIPKFVSALRDGADLVIGCRLPSGGGRIMPGAMPWMHRWIGTPILTWISRLFFGSPIGDINAGMRGVKRTAFDAMQLRTTGMEFASEMIIKASLMKLHCREVPITLHPDGRTRVPHLRSWRDGWRHLRFMLLFSPRWLFVFPGATLFVLGSLVHALLLPGPLLIGTVGFSVSTQLVAALSMLLGMQLTSLGIFAKAFAVSEGLMPGGSSLDRAGRFLRLEVGIIIGFLVMVFGGGLLLWAVMIWAKTDFGPLPDHHVARIVIASVTIIILGFQIITSSFFLGVLALNRRSLR